MAEFAKGTTATWKNVTSLCEDQGEVQATSNLKNLWSQQIAANFHGIRVLHACLMFFKSKGPFLPVTPGQRMPICEANSSMGRWQAKGIYFIISYSSKKN